jgi:hypothetical protein
MKTHQLLTMFLTLSLASAIVGCTPTQKTTPASVLPAAVQKHVSANTPEGVWDQMVSNLRTSDINGAVSFYSVASKDKYREAFTSLTKDELSSMAKDLGAIKQSSLEQDTAQYYFERSIDGQMITFPVEFVKEDGQWKIMEY